MKQIYKIALMLGVVGWAFSSLLLVNELTKEPPIFFRDSYQELLFKMIDFSTLAYSSNFNGIKISDAILYYQILESCETHNISDFYPLAGNHDGELNDKGQAKMIWNELVYYEYNYSVYVGNVQIIMNGVELTTNKVYNDEWLINEINSSANVIVCRHHNVFPIDDFSNSVFLLLHGHTHYQGMDDRIESFEGFKVIDISSIDFCHSGNSSHSYLFTFKNNSNLVTIDDFNHSSLVWTNYTMLYMKQPFVYDEEQVRLLFCSDLHVSNIKCGLTYNFNWSKKCFGDFDRFPEWEYCFILGDISDGESLYYLYEK